MPKPMPVLCLIASLFSISLTAQRGFDFSGNWVLDEDQVHPAADIPQRLVIRHTIASTDATGSPIPPTYFTMTVNRYFGDELRTETYRLGVTATERGRVTVEWHGPFLSVERQIALPSGAFDRPRREESWNLDDLGRLVIHIPNKSDQILAYRRNKQ
jgi:hypothetical protein